MFNEEVTPYGTPIIQRININNNIVGELISAIEKLVKVSNNKIESTSIEFIDNNIGLLS